MSFRHGRAQPSRPREFRPHGRPHPVTPGLDPGVHCRRLHGGPQGDAVAAVDARIESTAVRSGFSTWLRAHDREHLRPRCHPGRSAAESRGPGLPRTAIRGKPGESGACGPRNGIRGKPGPRIKPRTAIRGKSGVTSGGTRTAARSSRRRIPPWPRLSPRHARTRSGHPWAPPPLPSDRRSGGEAAWMAGSPPDLIRGPAMT